MWSVTVTLVYYLACYISVKVQCMYVAEVFSQLPGITAGHLVHEPKDTFKGCTKLGTIIYIYIYNIYIYIYILYIYRVTCHESSVRFLSMITSLVWHLDGFLSSQLFPRIVSVDGNTN